jgi:hypothetical protein
MPSFVVVQEEYSDRMALSLNRYKPKFTEKRVRQSHEGYDFPLATHSHPRLFTGKAARFGCGLNIT